MNGSWFSEEVPDWSPWAGVGALVASSLVALPALLLTAVLAAGAGAGSATPATILLLAVLTGGGTLLIVVWLARLTEPLHPEQLGLRVPPVAAVGLAALAAALLAGLLVAWSLVVDFDSALAVPRELDPRGPLARAYDLSLREPVAVGPGLVASALARCVIPAVIGEVLLRGFVFPALARWRGVLPAGVVVAVLFGGLLDLASGAALAVPSIALGVLLCGLYLATGSLLPGIALSAGAAGALFGASCGFDVGAAALLAVACALTAVGCVAPVVRRGHDLDVGASFRLRRRTA